MTTQNTLFPIPLLEATPENRVMLRRVLGLWCQYFGDSPFISADLRAWAKAQREMVGK